MGPEGSGSLKLPDFQTIVRLSAVSTGRLYAKEVFRKLISDVS